MLQHTLNKITEFEEKKINRVQFRTNITHGKTFFFTNENNNALKKKFKKQIMHGAAFPFLFRFRQRKIMQLLSF